MSQQIVAALCAYRGGMIPGVKTAVNMAFKTIPALQPFQDLKDEILKLPTKMDVRCIPSLKQPRTDMTNPLALVEIIKRPKTQKAVIEFLMSVKTSGAETAEEAINKMKEIAEGIILTLVPEEKVEEVIGIINDAPPKKNPPYTDLLSIIKDAQDPKFPANIKKIMENIKEPLENSLKNMNSLTSKDLIAGVQDPNIITRKCGLVVPDKIQAKIEAWKNVAGAAQGQFANAPGQLANLQDQAAKTQGQFANAPGQLANLQDQAAKTQGQLRVATNILDSQHKHIERMKKAQELRNQRMGGKRKTKKKRNKSRKRKSRKRKSRKRKSRKRKLRKIKSKRKSRKR